MPSMNSKKSYQYSLPYPTPDTIDLRLSFTSLAVGPRGRHGQRSSCSFYRGRAHHRSGCARSSEVDSTSLVSRIGDATYYWLLLSTQEVVLRVTHWHRRLASHFLVVARNAGSTLCSAEIATPSSSSAGRTSALGHGTNATVRTVRPQAWTVAVTRARRRLRGEGVLRWAISRC